MDSDCIQLTPDSEPVRQTNRYPYHIIGKPYDTIIIDVAGSFNAHQTLNTIADFMGMCGIHPNFNILWDFRRTRTLAIKPEGFESMGWSICRFKLDGMRQAVVCGNGRMISACQGIMRHTRQRIQDNSKYFLSIGHAIDWFSSMDGRRAA